jgi:mono/diheme cytochrome c family protein
MDRSVSKRRYLITTLAAAGVAALVPACTGTELPPEIDNPIHVSAKPPAAISGGTLTITSRDIAVAADPDRDLVWMVDLNTNAVSQVALKDGDEPGRVVEDGAGRVHVALRRGGAVATIDLTSGKVIDRTAVCAAPRGVAFDAKSNSIHVACAGGELVTLPATGGKATRVLHIGKDLRDVIVSGDRLVVSRFRTAELLVLDKDGKATSAQKPPGIATDIAPEENFGQPTFVPTVAYRVVPMGNSFAMVHQRSLVNPVVIDQPGGYGSDGGGCDGGIVHSGVTIFSDAGTPSPVATPAFPGAALPVDIAVDPTSDTIAIVAAGSDLVVRTNSASLANGNSNNVFCLNQDEPPIKVAGEPVALAFWHGRLLTQTRQPATLQFVGEGASPIVLPGVDMGDTGHDLFHRSANPANGLACASCHPEGREDGHVWQFSSLGARRTQTVGGHVLDTAPFHWDGDMPDIDAIMSEVFVHRMGGTEQGPRHSKVLQNWLGSLNAFPPSTPVAPQTSIEHGKALFNDAKVACASCHGGEHFTNNTNADVGTSKPFQVPTLIGVSARAPFMHNGCAPTLRDRFAKGNEECTGGDKHGVTSQLSSSDIDDLVNYLETL